MVHSNNTCNGRYQVEIIMTRLDSWINAAVVINFFFIFVANVIRRVFILGEIRMHMIGSWMIHIIFLYYKWTNSVCVLADQRKTFIFSGSMRTAKCFDFFANFKSTSADNETTCSIMTNHNKAFEQILKCIISIQLKGKKNVNCQNCMIPITTIWNICNRHVYCFYQSVCWKTQSSFCYSFCRWKWDDWNVGQQWSIMVGRVCCALIVRSTRRCTVRMYSMWLLHRQCPLPREAYAETRGPQPPVSFL